MWDVIGGAALGQVGNIAGALINKRASEKANQANKDMAEKNAAEQEEFAKMGIQWKVADAKAAGIHPLVALGAPTASFTPTVVQNSPDYSIGNAVASMGQDVGRAIQSTRTEDQRTLSNLQIQSAQLDLEGKALDNQIKNSQLSKMNQVGPAFPGSQNFISGQGNSGLAIQEVPLQRTRSMPGHPEAEPGALPSIGWMKTQTGIVPVPSKDVKERIEDNMPHEWSHYIRNNIAPNFGGGTTPPKSALPKGAIGWKWNYAAQEYQPKYPPRDPPASRSSDMRSSKMIY